MRRTYGGHCAWLDSLLRIDPARKLGSRYLDRVPGFPGEAA
jgi:hypothetical protein